MNEMISATEETKVNYLNLYYQNKDENKFVNFFKVDEDADIDNCSKEVKRLIAKLEEAKAKLEEEYAKKYSNKYSPLEKPNVFSYTTRNGEEYYYAISGNQVTDDDISANYHVINLETKHGDVAVIDGYCYELGSIIMKKYRYNVSGDNSRCSFRLYSECIIPFLDREVPVRTRTGYTERYRWEHEHVLSKYNADEFINTLYGINVTTGMNLQDAYRAYSTNAAFELILKTAPASLMTLLLRMRDIEKSEPVYKLIGLDKPLYEQALAEGMELQCYEMRNYILNKDVFHKTAPEWIEMIKEFAQKENDLNFFHITYANSWRCREYDHCKLLGVLAESYSNNKNFQKHYTFGKFSNYVVEETINQGFTHLEDFIQKLADYLRMCNDQNIVPTLYSSYLTQTHDIAARNHKVFLDQEQEKIIAKRYEDFKTVKVGKDKEYQVLAPTNSDDIKREGDALNHCVASYIKRVLDGETKIFFLRKDPLVSLITLEIKDGKICQARGMHNRRPSEEENKAIKEFAKKKELKFNCAY